MPNPTFIQNLLTKFEQGEQLKPDEEALLGRTVEILELQKRGDPAFQEGSTFFRSVHGTDVEKTLDRLRTLTREEGDETGFGGPSLTFAATEAGTRLAGAQSLEEERERGRQRLRLEKTLFDLAKELLPAGDVDDAIVRMKSADPKNRFIASKLQFQAALQALADRQDIALREQELQDRRDVELQTLKQARARITIDMIGKNTGRAVLFALGAGSNE